MKTLILAIQFLTRLPTPQVNDFQEQWLVESARWFPLVGLLIGGLLVAIGWPAAHLNVWLAAWLMLLMGVLVTGGLHLDGLADLSDALGASHRDPERLLAVMRDPHLGSFGVLSLLIHTSGKLVLLMLIARDQAWIALMLIPMWARWGIYHWQTLAPLSSGMAERFTWQQPKIARLCWGVGLIGLSVWFAPVLLVAPLIIGLYRVWLKQTLGGVSGDCLGAGVEITELALLAVVAVSLTI